MQHPKVSQRVRWVRSRYEHASVSHSTCKGPLDLGAESTHAWLQVFERSAAGLGSAAEQTSTAKPIRTSGPPVVYIFENLPQSLSKPRGYARWYPAHSTLRGAATSQLGMRKSHDTLRSRPSVTKAYGAVDIHGYACVDPRLLSLPRSSPVPEAFLDAPVAATRHYRAATRMICELRLACAEAHSVDRMRP